MGEMKVEILNLIRDFLEKNCNIKQRLLIYLFVRRLERHFEYF